MKPIAPDPEAERRVAQDVAREAASEQMARLAALNRPASGPLEPLPLEPKTPHLPPNFGPDMSKLVAQVERHGLAFDRAALRKQGKSEFSRLLQLDAKLRTEQRLIGPKTDLSSFESVLGPCRTFDIPLRQPRMHEEAYQRAYRATARVESFADLWKLSSHEPRAIRRLYEFRDCFEPLLFARSLLDAIGPDGRLHHASLADPARCSPVLPRLFAPWRTCLRGRLLSIALSEPEAGMVGWLSDDPVLASSLSTIVDSLAGTISGLRQPPAEQRALARAVLTAFVTGCDCALKPGGELLASWSAIGAQVRQPVDLGTIRQWRSILEAQFPRTLEFWRAHAGRFFLQKGAGFIAHAEFDGERFAVWSRELLWSRKLTLVAIIALATQEALRKTEAAAIVAILPAEIIVEVPLSFKRVDELTSAIQVQVERALAIAFGTTFPFRVTSL